MTPFLELGTDLRSSPRSQMATLTLEQDFAVEEIEADATRVHEDVAAGHRQVTLGTKFARAARKKRSVARCARAEAWR